MRCWWALPQGGPGQGAGRGSVKGVVLVLPEVFGVNGWVRSVTDRLAVEGFAALALPIFARTAPDLEFGYDEAGLAAGREHRDAVTAQGFLADVRRAIAFLQAEQPSAQQGLGCVGFCFGGHLALLAATLPEVAATCAFYGARVSSFRPGGGEPTENERLRAELQGIDTRIAALSDTLAAIGIRDQQIRLLAGLPGDSTADSSVAGAVAAMGGASRALASATPGTTASAGATPSTGLPKPFLGRLGFGARPDIEGLIKRATALSANFRAVNDTLTLNFERLANTPSIMPTTGWLSSHFTQSRFHPILHASRAHEGIDLAAPMGAPIIAPAAGRVISVANEPGYGRTFQIDHGSGIITRFAHCSRIIVHVGQVVTRGQPIATIGNSGLSTGPHLHYEVHVNGKPVDPLRFVLPDKVTD